MKNRSVADVITRSPPPDTVRMDRDLAKWLGALPPYCGLSCPDPVMLVEPKDDLQPGLFWPIDLDAYREE